MASAPARSHIPPLPLALSFGMALLALLLVAGARLTGVSPEQTLPGATAVESACCASSRAATAGSPCLTPPQGKPLPQPHPVPKASSRARCAASTAFACPTKLTVGLLTGWI